MGLTSTGTDIGTSPPPGRDTVRPASPATRALPNAGGGLAAVLGSEDSLFRDPFADFAPSGR